LGRPKFNEAGKGWAQRQGDRRKPQGRKSKGASIKNGGGGFGEKGVSAGKKFGDSLEGVLTKSNKSSHERLFPVKEMCRVGRA